MRSFTTANGFSRNAVTDLRHTFASRWNVAPGNHSGMCFTAASRTQSCPGR